MSQLLLPLLLPVLLPLLLAAILLTLTQATAWADTSAEYKQYVPWTPAPNTTVTNHRTPDVIRLATTGDYPPFNFFTETTSNNKLSLIGFNITLVRTICDTIKVKCTMQSLKGSELEQALSSGEVDVIIAGHELSPALLSKFKASVPYFLTPARFAIKIQPDGSTNRQVAIDPLQWLRGAMIGVKADSSYARFLNDHFPELRTLKFKDDRLMYKALTSNHVSAIFGDAVKLAVWLNSDASKNCCQLAGKPYFTSGYFGQGMVMLFRPQDSGIKQLFDNAMHQIIAAKKYREIFLRYFPISPY